MRPTATSWGVSKMWMGGKSRSSASRGSMYARAELVVPRSMPIFMLVPAYVRARGEWLLGGHCSGSVLNGAVRRDVIRLEGQRLGPAGEMLQARLFLQRLDTPRRTAQHLPEGELFKNHRGQSVLFLGRHLRQRGHGLPQQFSHRSIL